MACFVLGCPEFTEQVLRVGDTHAVWLCDPHWSSWWAELSSKTGGAAAGAELDGNMLGFLKSWADRMSTFRPGLE